MARREDFQAMVLSPGGLATGSAVACCRLLRQSGQRHIAAVSDGIGEIGGKFMHQQLDRGLQLKRSPQDGQEGFVMAASSDPELQRIILRMCGRFTLLTLGQFTDLFPWIRMPAMPLGSRYNIAPSQAIAVVPNDGQNQIDFYRWGLVPFWAKDPAIGNRMINARVESLADKPAFRNALRSCRCLIPADGFYEWKRAVGGRKIPMYIRLKSHAPFAFAGLWEKWRAPDGGELRSCTIVTCAANELVRPIHDRMPVIVRPEHFRSWIEPAERKPHDLLPLLSGYPAAEMEAYPVSAAVNNPKGDGPDCIALVEAPASAAQPTLFDQVQM
jgi:putative SOS response-associated peptidase YedK